jgi:RNA polymerase subunit RPABC4/transcription elongation factor Spt4
MADQETQTPSVSELLNTVDEEREGMILCTNCGMESPDGTRTCPGCGDRLSWPTLIECGKTLPIGVEENGKLTKNFDLVALGWKIEKKIGESWEGRRDRITISDYIGTILAHTVTQIGGIEMAKHKFAKRLLIFNQMYAADVFYMYAYLRFVSLGKELRLKDTPCPNCSHRFLFFADVTSLEIITIGEPSQLEKEIKLRDGFEMGGDQRFAITVRPSRWNMLGSNLTGKALVSDADMFASMLINSVCGVDGMPAGASITEMQIEQLTKYDMAGIEEAMDEVVGGPQWQVEGECPKCHQPFFHLIDWSYDNFFARSSRSPRRGRRSRI